MDRASLTSSSPAFMRFMRDATASIDDPHAVADRLAELLAQDGWLADEHQAPGTDTYRQHLLYVSRCRRLSVVSLVWRPGQRTPIHDHVSWCVVGVYRGVERETRYRRVVGVYRGVERETRYRLVEADGRRCLEPAGSVEAHPGHVEALVPPAEDIHSVAATGDGLTVSIHVYGADIEVLGSSIYRRFDDLELLAPAA